jgi:hypothetical protein
MTTKLLTSVLIATGLAFSPAAFAEGMKKDEPKAMMDKKTDTMKKADDMKKTDAMKKADDKKDNMMKK